MLVSEHVLKCVAAALRPLGVVVAGNEVIWLAERVEQGFGGSYLLVGAEVGNVSSKYYKVERILLVDVPDAEAQVAEGV